MPEGLFGKAEILAYLGDVAELLATEDQSRATLIVVGGSYLVLHDLRSMGTRDVDSIERLTLTVRRAVERVAAANDLSTDWLNDRAAMFAPVGFLRTECSVLFEHEALLVLGPSPDCVFLMKLLRRVRSTATTWLRYGRTAPSQAHGRRPGGTRAPTHMRKTTHTSWITSQSWLRSGRVNANGGPDSPSVNDAKSTSCVLAL